MTSLTFFFILIPILTLILLAINIVLSLHNPYPEKSIDKKSLSFYLEILVFVMLFIMIISYIAGIIINLISLTNHFNFNIIFSVKDTATIEIDKVKLEGLGLQIDKLRDGSIYIAGLATGAKIVKSSSIPIVAKIATTVVIGGLSLTGFRVVQNILEPKLQTGRVIASIDKISGNIKDSSNNKSNYINKLTDQSSNSNEDYNIISSLDIEQLQLIFYMNLMIMFLLIMTIIFLIMKYISSLNMKFDFLLKLPYGKSIQSLFIKLLNLWSLTSIIWVYIILIVILTNVGISAWAIYVILSHI